MSPIHLSRSSKTWINCVGIGIWASGLGWLLVHYGMRPADSLDFARRSAEPAWLRIHGAFAFLALWTGGMLWGVHVVKAWRTRKLRWSGSTLFGGVLVLCVTGYLLYYVADEAGRTAISLTHWILGIALPVAYLIHRLAKKKRAPRP